MTAEALTLCQPLSPLHATRSSVPASRENRLRSTQRTIAHRIPVPSCSSAVSAGAKKVCPVTLIGHTFVSFLSTESKQSQGRQRCNATHGQIAGVIHCSRFCSCYRCQLTHPLLRPLCTPQHRTARQRSRFKGAACACTTRCCSADVPVERPQARCEFGDGEQWGSSDVPSCTVILPCLHACEFTHSHLCMLVLAIADRGIRISHWLLIDRACPTQRRDNSCCSCSLSTH